MKYIFLFLIVLINSGVYSQIDIKNEIYQPKTELNGQLIIHNYYNLYFSENYKQSLWVSYLLTTKMVKDGDNDIERLTYFKKDNLLNLESNSHSDYNNSGYDRGHLAPARDFKFNEIAYRETFLTSNISPQTKELNRYEWKYLEEYIRDITIKNDSILIITGPIFSDKKIGKLSIPIAFWKIIYKNEQVVSYLLYNSSEQIDFECCLTTVDLIEKLTNIDFLSWLDDEIENKIESEINKNF